MKFQRDGLMAADDNQVCARNDDFQKTVRPYFSLVNRWRNLITSASIKYFYLCVWNAFKD